jgi:trimethylamine monooxygenase
MPRICVIGAGPAGMSMLIQLKLREREGLGPFEITCFESQPTWGGVWNYTWRTGINFTNILVEAFTFKSYKCCFFVLVV